MGSRKYTAEQLEDIRLVRPIKGDAYYLDIKRGVIVSDKKIPHPCFIPELLPEDLNDTPDTAAKLNILGRKNLKK